MKLSFFAEDKYGMIIGEELKSRGYDVLFNELDNDVDMCFVMCAISGFRLQQYLAKRWELEKFLYTGEITYNVLDIPEWRLNEDTWKSFYNSYNKMLKNADYITTISKFTTDQLKKIWGFDSEPLFRVFNNKDVEKYKKDVKREKQITCVSRFVPHKRFELVITALADTDWKLVIIGKGGPLSKFYKNLAEQLNVDCEIYENTTSVFIIEELCKSKLCIHPSAFEGLSLVPKEALWCDTPVIISDIPVHKEYHKDTVTYFKTNNLEDLKDKINKVTMNPKEGKKQIEQFTIEKITDKVEKWLKRLK